MKFSIEAITHTLLGHLSVSTWQSPTSAAHREASLSRFNWSTISPTSELIYEDCYKGLECSRLEVPLDWSNLSNPNKVVLAIARLPAVVNESDPSFGGTIVLNPGGPGGSGIDLIVKTGRWLQKIVDSNKHFELLSFDPRGVHYTTPPSACFGDPLSRQVWDLKNKATGPVDLTQEVIDIKWSAYEGLGKLCEERADFPDGSSILKYSSTPLVARDMVAIIDKLDDRLRKTLRAQANVLERPNDKNGELQDVLASAGDKSQEKPLLQYWGFSYGTILGNYFATLHPDRIGRMILDGVADANDYHGSPGWVTNLVDADAVLDSFYSYCYDGGDRCPLYRKADKGPQDIEGRVNALLERLLINPMATVHNGTTELITFADLRMQFVSALYGPLQYFPGLAQVLADLMFGNITSMITRLVHLQLPSVEATRELEVDEDPDIEREPVPFPEVSYDHGDEATNAILCGDRDLWPEVTKAAFREYVNILTGQSKTCGARWAEITLPCLHWPRSIRPSKANRYTGPFKTARSDYDKRASPLLFIGNTADPVTPLRNAFKMAEGHEASAVLHQDSGGHCSVLGSPSSCTREVIRTFFATGELPANGKICRGDRVPWDGKDAAGVEHQSPVGSEFEPI